MTLLDALTVINTVAGLSGWLLLGRRPFMGWVLALTATSAWIIYVLLTQQTGFLPSAGVTAVLQGAGMYKASPLKGRVRFRRRQLRLRRRWGA